MSDWPQVDPACWGVATPPVTAAEVAALLEEEPAPPSILQEARVMEMAIKSTNPIFFMFLILCDTIFID